MTAQDSALQQDSLGDVWLEHRCSLEEQLQATQLQLDQERKVVHKRGQEIDRQLRRAEGLEEQLEALQRAGRKFLATGNEIDLADLITPGEYTVDLIPHQWLGYASSPAKRPT